MAEGGKQSDDENPFSFKNFVTKKDTKDSVVESSSADDEFDIFAIPDVMPSKRREQSKKIVVIEADDDLPTQRKKGKSDNPFSFKKFLSGPVKPSNGSVNIPTIENTHSAPHPKTTTSIGSTSNMPIPSDLPDFVQDHYSDNKRARQLKKLPNANQDEVPSFADVNEQLDSVDKVLLKSSSNTPLSDKVKTPSVMNISSSLEDIDQFSDTLVSSSSDLIASLPDFLSDGAINSSRVQSNNTSHSLSEENPELKLLQAENDRLRRHLEETRRLQTQDALRVSELQQQLVAQKKKEAEETAAMEHAMEKVEENLSLTTKRAVQAESTVTRLKQELKAAQ
ncbi:hypothetical protein DPMN_173781, partial [Dreissena polymorpha]